MFLKLYSVMLSVMSFHVSSLCCHFDYLNISRPIQPPFLQVSFVQDTPDVAQKKSHAGWVKGTVTVMMNARDTTLAELTIVTLTDFPVLQITMIAALEDTMVRVRISCCLFF